MATVTKWTTAEFAFPLQVVLFNTVLVVLITTKLGPRIRGTYLTPLHDVEHVLPSIHEEESHG